jgi:acetyl-CoA synthetase
MSCTYPVQSSHCGVAADDYQELGDTSTLADPSVVEDLIEHRMKR